MYHTDMAANTRKTHMMKSSLSIVVALGIVLASACAQNHKSQVFRAALRSDFSGAWEMDYSLNDSVQAKVNNYLYRMRKEAQRQSPHPGMDSQTTPLKGYSGYAATLVAMAQFVEEITRIAVINIEQSYNAIHIEREGTFSFDCQFDDDSLQSYDTVFGKEVCGWDGHQLVFLLRLPEGVTLQHRLTLSSDGQQMNVATTVMSGKAFEPFTLNRAYMRFDGVPKNYHCEQTVTKGKVCSLAPATKSKR